MRNTTKKESIFYLDKVVHKKLQNWNQWAEHTKVCKICFLVNDKRSIWSVCGSSEDSYQNNTGLCREIPASS